MLLLLPVVVIALMPLILLQRYRVGTARRLARPWMASLNLGAMLLSAVFFLTGAALTTLGYRVRSPSPPAASASACCWEWWGSG